jgi:glycosyltransferase involved in cell wall biosynthesis
LVYDTHELETESAVSTGVRKPIMKLLERACMYFVDATFVVGDRIGRWYRETYKIDPVVIKNMPRRVAIGTEPSDLRARCGIPREAVVFIYLGIVAPGRGIERTMELFEECPQFHVVFMGDGPLSKEVGRAHERHPNIHYVPAVPPADVAAVARGADVGIWLQTITCLSYAYASPNKFFEYLQAGLPVMVQDDAVELRELIELHGIGWVVPQNQSEILTRLRGIDRGAIEQARRSVLHIQPQMHWGVERAKLVDAYRAIVARALTQKSPDA